MTKNNSRPQFPLFSSHLDLAHSYWKRLLSPEDAVCDATCGNGHDSLFLANLPVKRLYLFDIQQKAIDATLLLLKESTVEVIPNTLCHSKMHTIIPKSTLKLIAYNLGYLPGSDKTIKTGSESTLESLKTSLDLIQDGGAISITCYPGHKEGKEEEKDLLEYCGGLAKGEWCVCHHRWINREDAPSLLLLQKQKVILKFGNIPIA